MLNKIIRLILLGVFVIILSACNSGGDSGGSSSPSGPIQPDMHLVSISINPESASINLMGGSQQFTALGSFSDGTSKDITESVTWASDNETIANVSNTQGENGFTKAIGVGQAHIIASLSGVTASATINVSPAVLESIEITPTSVNMPIGVTQQFTAIGHYADGTSRDVTQTVVWSSSETSVATINAHGLATSLANGSTSITASLNNISAHATLTVTQAQLTKIDLTPLNESIPVGLSQQYKAVGTYSDHSTRDITQTVIWSSSISSIATIESQGLAKALAVGTTTITASFGSVSGHATLDVISATLVSIDITPKNASIPVNAQQSYTAVGTYSDQSSRIITNSVIWISSDTTVATINTNGIAHALKVGQITITASLGSITANTPLTVTADTLISIQVTPVNATIDLGNSQAFKATGIYASGESLDITNQVTWASSDSAVAKINASGIAQSVTIGGPINITATLQSIVGSAQLTVINGASNLPGWPNYLAMGGISGGDIAEPTTKVDSVFTYNGANGGGDRGMLKTHIRFLI